MALLMIRSPLYGEPHTWTTLDGKTAIAEFVAVDGDTLLLKKGDNTFRIQIDKLSAEDQDYARTCAAEKNQAEALFLNAPLQIYEGEQYQGTKGGIESCRIYSGSEIPESLNNSISYLILRKGFQAAIAVEEDGGGLSKVLIAAKRDIRIPKLSAPFNDRIRFIRVLPWRNTIKKGHGGTDYADLNNGWYYLWGGTGHTSEEIQWVPMAYTRKWTEPARVDQLIATEGIQAILGYNEPERAPPAGVKQYKDSFLREPENCVITMKNLMRTGLRIGSPSCAQQGPGEWLPEFYRLAKQQNCRIDFICVHWYDWGNFFSGNDQNPKGVFNRFRNYLENIYSTYKLPIWITEFNANPNRNNEIQMEFLRLAMPWMDSAPYIERYAYFQPFGQGDVPKREGDSNFRRIRSDTSTPLTPIGRFWRDHKSAPAMDEEVYLGKNNLCEDEREE